MFDFNYPTFLPNLSFLGSIFLVATINYFVNIQNISKTAKYIITAVCLLIVYIIPYPYFIENRSFGGIPITSADYRGFIPFTQLFYIVVMFKYYSVMIEIIRRKQPIPPLPFVLLFLFYIPHYVYNFSVTGPKDKNREENRPKHFKKLWISIAEFFIIWILLYFIFTYVDIPWKLTVSVFRGWWGIPIVICTGIVVLMIFKLAAAVINIMPVLFNILGGYNFQYYENGAFKATSISEFWRRWNVWGNEWFFTYFYRPLRRKMHFTHSQAMLTVFTFSALIHAAVIAYVNPQWAWLTFLAFFLNGLVTVFEAPALKHFPFIAKWPTWVNYILTFIFLDITMGLFGLCFS